MKPRWLLSTVHAGAPLGTFTRRLIRVPFLLSVDTPYLTLTVKHLFLKVKCSCLCVFFFALCSMVLLSSTRIGLSIMTQMTGNLIGFPTAEYGYIGTRSTSTHSCASQISCHADVAIRNPRSLLHHMVSGHTAVVTGRRQSTIAVATCLRSEYATMDMRIQIVLEEVVIGVPIVPLEVEELSAQDLYHHHVEFRTELPPECLEKSQQAVNQTSN